MPLPTMVKILEKSTMEPWYRTDESRQQIGKKEVQTLVYDTLNTTMVHVEKDKKRPALYIGARQEWCSDRPHTTVIQATESSATTAT